MPNLEELTMNKQLSNIQALPTTGSNIHNLSILKILSINMNTMNSFISSTKNVTKLEKLTVFISTEDDHDILTNFVAQQRNLKELELLFDSELTSINFPSSDITSKLQTKPLWHTQNPIKVDISVIDNLNVWVSGLESG